MTGAPRHPAQLPRPEIDTRGRATVFLHDRPIDIRLSEAALAAAGRRQGPLIVEMELFFSCLLRKRVLFHEPDSAPVPELEPIPVHPNLTLQFRPIVAEVCRIDTLDGEPPVRTMPARRGEAFIPRWLKLDYRNHHWAGEFGY